MSAFSKWGRRFLGGFRPVNYGAGELFLMRLFFAMAVLLALPDGGDIGGIKEMDHPVGLGHFFKDLPVLAPHTETCWWVIAGALAFYVAGYLVWLALPVATLLFCALGAIDNSQEVAKHSIQIVGLVLLVQSIYYMFVAVKIGRGKSTEDAGSTHGVAVWYAQQTIAAAYVVTAITKLWNSGGTWIKDAKFFPLQLEKTRLSDFYNRLGVEKDTGDPGAWDRMVGMLDGVSLWIQNLLVGNPNLCRAILAAGLLLEIFAFLALRGRLALFLYGVALIGFHLTIGRIMNLHFNSHNLVLLVFWVNLPFIFFWMWGRVSGASVEKS